MHGFRSCLYNYIREFTQSMLLLFYEHHFRERPRKPQVQLNVSETGVESVYPALSHMKKLLCLLRHTALHDAYTAANKITDSCHHNYEDVKICDLDVPTSHEGDIKIQQCSAYGVITKKN